VTGLEVMARLYPLRDRCYHRLEGHGTVSATIKQIALIRKREMNNRLTMRSLWYIILMLVISIIALYMWYYVFRRRPANNYGDCVLIDRGWTAYRPRWLVLFDEIPLTENGDYKFNIKNIPSEHYIVLLYVRKKHGSVDPNNVIINMEIRDYYDNKVCSFEESLAAFRHPTTETTEAYWSRNCNDIGLSDLNNYMLHIRVKYNGNSDMNKLSVQPTLEGGGIELP
jgi:hypothetical protein